MKLKRLGKTDLEVSEIGFGGIPIIPLLKGDAVTVIRHCFDKGITFFDSANAYATSEAKIGAALEPVRKEVVIATKTGMRDAKGAAEHIELSLNKLKTDWIDLYQFHNVSSGEALEQIQGPNGAYEAVSRAQKEGKIRFIGITSHNMPVAMEALKTGLFQTLQFPFNFIENDPLSELFPLAQSMDIGIIGMKPLGGGLLEHARLCFGFLQQYPYVLPIPGMRAKSELDEIITLYENPQPLTEADIKQMDEIRATLGKKFCHRCEYCMPCEQGVSITGVLMFKAAAKRLTPSTVGMWLKEAMATVENCIECRECEDKCPYNLPIPELIKENLALYSAMVK